MQGLWVVVPTEEDIESTVQQLQFWLDSTLKCTFTPLTRDTFSGLSPMSKVVRQQNHHQPSVVHPAMRCGLLGVWSAASHAL